jgi:2-phosphosulfolactate phosphatase
MFTDQSLYDVRFEWGERGMDAVSGDCGVIVIVDVFSFSTAVDVATSHGAIVFPARTRDEAAAAFAEAHGAILAADIRTTGRRSLSPTSLVGIEAGTRLVLPSRNGAALSVKALHHAIVVTACLRNATAVARFIRSQRGPVAVIGSGERWPDDTLRPAWEDLIGAGAVIDGLMGTLSPEAEAARDAFRAASSDIPQRLRACSSGRELIERGFVGDVEIASAVNVSPTVPLLIDGAYVRAGG